jgi:hypothetical protein
VNELGNLADSRDTPRGGDPLSTTARHLRNEADYLPDDLADLIQLRKEIRAAGYTRRTADGLCSWLLAKAAGEPDETAATTRAEYRRILSKMAGEEPNQPGSGKPPVILEPSVTSSAPEDQWVARLRAASSSSRRGRRSLLHRAR